MSGGFKRSSRFGIVGVFVVAALCAAIGLTLGSGQSNPKLALGLIFAVVAIYLFLLFALQRGDLERAASGDARSSSRAAAEQAGPIEDPTRLSEADLWAAMAVAPIDAEALRARSAMWEAGRRSLRLGIVIAVLIFVTVPSIYLFESFLPLLVGGPLIVAAALWGGIRALMPGGELDRGYEDVNRAMAPLGLRVSSRPEVTIEMREPVSGRYGPRMRGALVLSGERHGRSVGVRLGGDARTGASEVTVRGGFEQFEADSSDGRLRPGSGAPRSVAAVLREVPRSPRWKRVGVRGGAEGLVVTRRSGAQADWLCDLWLAEHLAAS